MSSAVMLSLLAIGIVGHMHPGQGNLAVTDTTPRFPLDGILSMPSTTPSENGNETSNHGLP